MNGNLLLPSITEARRDIADRPGADNTQRPDRVDARVTSVKLKKDFVAADISRDQASKVCLDPLSLLVNLGHEIPCDRTVHEILPVAPQDLPMRDWAGSTVQGRSP
jgi:hypothetical protein